MGEVLFKIHRLNRWVVAICDKDVYGRRVLEGDYCFDLMGSFFDGEEMDLDEAREMIRRCVLEDASFNIVGEKSVGIALEEGIISREGIREISGIPVALVLL